MLKGEEHFVNPNPVTMSQEECLAQEGQVTVKMQCSSQGHRIIWDQDMIQTREHPLGDQTKTRGVREQDFI